MYCGMQKWLVEQEGGDMGLAVQYQVLPVKKYWKKMGVKQTEKVRRNFPRQEIVHAKEYMYERTWKIQRSISSWL